MIKKSVADYPLVILALALSAYGQAADFFTDALELTSPDDPARPRLLLLRGRAVGPLDTLGDGLQAELVRQVDDRAEQGPAALGGEVADE